MKKLYSRIFCVALMMLSFSAFADYSLDAVILSGNNCSARTPSDEAGLRYGYYGRLSNVSDEDIQIVCSFQQPQDSADLYGVYIYGGGLSDTFRSVSCKLWVADMFTGKRKSESGVGIGIKDGKSFRTFIGDVSTMTTSTSLGPDAVTLQCTLEPQTYFSGAKLFRTVIN